MFENQKFLYQLLPLFVILIIQCVHEVHGYIVKVNVSQRSDGYYLNDKVPISFATDDVLKVYCVENTDVSLVGQNNIKSSIFKLNCKNDYEGSVTLPNNIDNFGEDINNYKLIWKYTDKTTNEDIDVESDIFKIKKELNPKNETNDHSNNNNNNNNNNNGINNNVSGNSTAEIKNENKSSELIGSPNGNTTSIIETDPTNTKTNSTINIDNTTEINASMNNSNKKDNEDNQELSLLNKIMFIIIICLIGGIMVISVKLIKTKNENKMRKIRGGRIQDNPIVNEIKFPSLRMNPLESESFLNINNSTTFDLLDSSKMTSIYVPYEESVIPGNNSNVTFPINKNIKNDNDNPQSIFSSP